MPSYNTGPPYEYGVTIVQEGQRRFAPEPRMTATLYGTGGEVLGGGAYDGRFAIVMVPYSGNGHPRFLLVERPGYYVAGLNIHAKPVITPVPLLVELRPHPALVRPANVGDFVTVTVTSAFAACAGAGHSVYWWAEDGRELDRATTDVRGIAQLRRVSPEEHPRFLLTESDGLCQVTGLPYEEGVIDYPLAVEVSELR